MRWRKLKNQIQQYPYLVVDACKLSMSDAQRLIDGGNAMTFEEMIQGAMAKSSTPTHKWEECVPALRRSKKRIPKAGHKKTWIAIASVAAAVVLFFAITPIGRAWAKGAIDYVVKIFNGRMIVENRNGSPYLDGEIIFESAPPKPSGEIAEGDDPQEISYSSMEELYNGTGLNPILIDHPSVFIREIQYCNDPVETRVTIIYSSERFGELVTHQYWNTAEGMAIGMEDDYFTVTVLPQEYTMYCCITPEDNWFNGNIVFDDSVFQIGFANEVDSNSILESLKFYKNEEE